MSTPEVIAALEIGTSRTVLAIGETTTPGRVKITALEEIPSSGMRKSQITDIAQASVSVEAVLRQAEKKSHTKISEVFLAVTGPHVRSKTCTYQLQINGPKVTEQDLAEIYNLSIYSSIDPEQRTILEVEEQGFGLDEQNEILQPLGMTGRLLRQYNLCVHADAKQIANARSAADERAHLSVLEPYFGPACAAAAVLTPESRRDGVLVVDLGGGTTGYTVWHENRMVYANVLGVGGDHVTNDISYAFGLTRAQAEQIKRQSRAIVEAGTDSPRLEVPATTPGFAPVNLSRRALDTVVNARLQEIFSIILTDLSHQGMLHRIHNGVVLTGGGSAQQDIVRLASNVFGRPACIGTLQPAIEGLPEDLAHPASYATLAGLILRASEHNKTQETFFSPFKRILGGIFGK